MNKRGLWVPRNVPNEKKKKKKILFKTRLGFVERGFESAEFVKIPFETAQQPYV